MKTYKQFITEIQDALYKKDKNAGAKMLADATPKDFVHDYTNSGTAKFIGQHVPTHKHIAALAQVVRNPHYETLHTVYTKDNKVVGHSAVSNRLPGQVKFYHDKASAMEHFDTMKEHMKNLSADGYWMVHNHPSGDPTPSEGDHHVTNLMAAHVPGFKGHIIVNHKKYAHIPQENVHTSSLHDIDQQTSYSKDAKVPHDSLDKPAYTGKDISTVAKQFEHPDHATVFGIKPGNKVKAVAHIPLHRLYGGTPKKENESKARLRNFIKMTGSESNAVMSVPTMDDVHKMKHLITSGIVDEIVPHNYSGESGTTHYSPENNYADLGGTVRKYNHENF